MDQSYLKYECKAGSFVFALNSKNISGWKSTGIYNHSSKSIMNVLQTQKLIYLILEMMAECMFI